MLITKSIKSNPVASDGRRISVMSRHTLSDGITIDPEITSDMFDEWWPELSPPSLIIGAYYKRGLDWPKFEQAYNDHLQLPHIARKITDLIDLAQNQIVTVMCIENDPEQCHRRLLAEKCLLLSPGLEVKIT